jgi:hypothetical protein
MDAAAAVIGLQRVVLAIQAELGVGDAAGGLQDIASCQTLSCKLQFSCCPQQHIIIVWLAAFCIPAGLGHPRWQVCRPCATEQRQLMEWQPILTLRQGCNATCCEHAY